MLEDVSLPQRLAANAAAVTQSVRSTHYQHDQTIDLSTGTYDLDCSEFVSYLLELVAPAHYSRVPRQGDQPCPRADEYCDFIQSLSTDDTGWSGWRRVASLRDAQPGDVLAWKLAAASPGQDTGHVAIVAGPCTPVSDGVVSVWVYDASDIPHAADSRTDAGSFTDGVGSGTLLFQIDENGIPTAVQFAPPDAFHAVPIAVGRLEPFATTACGPKPTAS